MPYIIRSRKYKRKQTTDDELPPLKQKRVGYPVSALWCIMCARATLLYITLQLRIDISETTKQAIQISIRYLGLVRSIVMRRSNNQRPCFPRITYMCKYKYTRQFTEDISTSLFFFCRGIFRTQQCNMALKRIERENIIYTKDREDAIENRIKRCIFKKKSAAFHVYTRLLRIFHIEGAVNRPVSRFCSIYVFFEANNNQRPSDRALHLVRHRERRSVRNQYVQRRIAEGRRVISLQLREIDGRAIRNTHKSATALLIRPSDMSND